MKRIALIALLAAFIVAAAQAKPKKQTIPSALFQQARYVYVETPDGDAFTPGLLPEDRQAIFDVQKALQAWNRYVLADRRSQAELIFVVRTGRVITGDGHVGFSTSNRSPNGSISPGNSGQPGNSAGGGVEVGPPADLLWVYTRHEDGSAGIPIWQKTEDGGLRSPNVPLLVELKDEVDAAYPMK
jgi:hypothetical protein